MNETLPEREVVLLGVGHTNAYVLKQWRMEPLAGARLTCISDFALATYSGMLPGTLAGLYPPERMQIDLVRLCAAAGARLICARVTGLDLEGRQVLLADRPAVPFDVLSIGIGSVPRRDVPVENERLVLPIKPMQTFLPRLRQRLEELLAEGRQELRVAVVGGGAGGVEIAFCLPHYLRCHFPQAACRLAVIDRRESLLSGSPRQTARLAERELRRRGVELLLGRGVARVEGARLVMDNGSLRDIDLAIWATSAAAPPLLSTLGLPTDEQGFLLTRPTLQTVADAPVFAVGDSGSVAGHPRPKAGVYAVRQGPVLWDNLRRLLRGEPLRPYVPQRGFLSLLAMGDGQAILSYKGLTARGRWCWRLKDRIDSRFMDMYQDYRPAMRDARPTAAPSPPPMRCAGCGAKLGGSILSAVLRRLEIPPAEHVLLGLDAPDDAAIVRCPQGRPVAVTVDFFTAFLDDAWLVGRVAALNSLSDVFALGATPLAALAMATIPAGRPRQQEQLLFELLSGALEEFRRAGATLVGGHTIEGSPTTIGFSVLADAGDGPAMLKAGLCPGDALVLTKPLGTGILLAAHREARLRAHWFDTLVAAMLLSNGPAAAAARTHGVQAMTDVTGFGLAGHLLEMLRAGRVSARLELGALPLLPGAGELAAAGVASTLAPANRAAEAAIDCPHPLQQQPAYSILFDPQTSGGLLLGVRPEAVGNLVRDLHAAGHTAARIIGEVLPCQHEPRLMLA
jgi:selenide,water dikinase